MENKISKIAMYVLLGVTIVVACLFFFGGNVDDSAEYVEPVFTNSLLYLTYCFVGIAALLVIIAAVANLATDFRKDAKSALKSVGGVCALVVLFVVSYFVSSGEPVAVLGIEEEVTTATYKMVDAQLYTTYVLLIIAVILMICGNFAKKLK